MTPLRLHRPPPGYTWDVRDNRPRGITIRMYERVFGIFRTTHPRNFVAELHTIGLTAEDDAWKWTKDHYDAKAKPSPEIVYTTTPPRRQHEQD